MRAHGNGVVAQDAGNFLLPIGPCDIVIVHHHVLFYHFLFRLESEDSTEIFTITKMIADGLSMEKSSLNFFEYSDCQLLYLNYQCGRFESAFVLGTSDPPEFAHRIQGRIDMSFMLLVNIKSNGK